MSDEKEIKIEVNDGVAKIHKEPYTIIECPTKKDFEGIETAVKIKQHLKTCLTCKTIGCSKCTEFRENFEAVL